MKVGENKGPCKGKVKISLGVHNELDKLKPIFLFHLYLTFAILSQLPSEIFITVLGACLLSFLFFLFLCLVNFLLPRFVTCSSFLDSLNYFLEA